MNNVNTGDIALVIRPIFDLPGTLGRQVEVGPRCECIVNYVAWQLKEPLRVYAGWSGSYAVGCAPDRCLMKVGDSQPQHLPLGEDFISLEGEQA